MTYKRYLLDWRNPQRIVVGFLTGVHPSSFLTNDGDTNLVETGFAAVGLLLSALTIAVPTWIEALTRTDPDGRPGALEWVVAASLLAMAAASAGHAHGEWRLAQAAQSS